MVGHATIGSDRRGSSQSTAGTFKFPDFTTPSEEDDTFEVISRGPSPKPLPNGLPPGLHSSARWPYRKQSQPWINGTAGGSRHGRQKSLSEAIQTVRTRKMSMTETAQEITESLKAPVSIRLVVLCAAWYSTSILTNTSSKAILTALNKPVTLTVMQFFLVTFWCVFLASLAKRNSFVRKHLPVLKNGIRRPSKEIILVTLPLTAFQIGGHILNSDAMARIPVSLVHTIKGLSPLMTVTAYRVFYNIEYSVPTYLSLVPLTLGVVMACSASFKGNFLGLTYALGSTVLFVTQNIVSKKIFNDAAKAEEDGLPVSRRKPDKLNLLCYSSALAFLVTLPIWLWSEGFGLMADYLHDGSIDLRDRPDALDHGRLALEFAFNGTFHFGQSLIAFVLLGMVSPVTYSVASLIKRVAVIIFAIIWFGNPMSRIQGFGFVLTFLGLYLYDRTSDAAKADKRAREKGTLDAPLLPLVTSDSWRQEHPIQESPLGEADAVMPVSAGTFGLVNREPAARVPDRPASRMAMPNGAPDPLPLVTKAEDTWSQRNNPRTESVR